MIIENFETKAREGKCTFFWKQNKCGLLFSRRRYVHRRELKKKSDHNSNSCIGLMTSDWCSNSSDYPTLFNAYGEIEFHNSITQFELDFFLFGADWVEWTKSGAGRRGRFSIFALLNTITSNLQLPKWTLNFGRSFDRPDDFVSTGFSRIYCCLK